MKLKYIFFILMGFSLINYAAPMVTLALLRSNNGAGSITSGPVEGLAVREAKYRSGAPANNAPGTNYIAETKAAITRELKESGNKESFEVSKVVFTSEKSKWIAGQQQVMLSFTYELKYKGQKSKKLNGSIILASDEAGKIFDSTIEI